MANAGLGFRRVDGLGERSVSGTLAGLLALTSDAVLAFDGMGRILLANEAAERLFRSRELVGSDVRALFPPAVGVVPEAPFDARALPFSTDGNTTSLVCGGAHGEPVGVAVRCQRVSAPGETYLLVAYEDDSEQAEAREHDRLVRELQRANHRLSGTLSIVLETLDSKDVQTLFERVLEELTDTMDATGTVFYVAESDGYHLRGTSSSLDEGRVPRFMPSGRNIERLVTQVGHSLRLRVLAPQGAELRRGRLVRRNVVNEETHEVYHVLSAMLPPFVSFFAVPVWFGRHLIALIEVGWDQMHPMRREDAELLDAVAQYLSVQLAGAFSAMRVQREQDLREASSGIREDMMSLGAVDEQTVRAALQSAGGVLGATCHMLGEDPQAPGKIAVEVPGGDDALLDVDLGAVEADLAGQEVVVMPVAPDSDLAAALLKAGLPTVGALVDVGMVGERRSFCLELREAGAEPLDDLELAFLERVATDANGLAHGDEARRQDKRISQALQTGMRNELQQVPGISADGIYSSATQAAVIGGDFYDLIRLPGDRACVIMGDVSGKGVEAASVSAAVRTALGAYSWQGLSPAHMVRLLNEFLLGFSRLETFATLFVGMVDLAAGRLTYCSAGHPPAFLIRADTGAIEALDVQSGVVGAFHEMRYRNGRTDVRPGDMLLLYTDGTTEARATDGSFFGEDGLRDAVMREAPKGFDGLLGRLLDALDRFTSRHLEDDVAMVALRFDEVGKGPSARA